MAAREESTRNETADIKLNMATFSLRCGWMRSPSRRLDSALAQSTPLSKLRPFVLEDRPHHPFCPPTSQPPQPIHFVLTTKISLTTLCVVGRFCVLYQKKKPRGKCRCPLVVSVGVMFTASLDASKQWSVVCPLGPEIVHGCERQRAGPPPVCRSRRELDEPARAVTQTGALCGR